MKLFKHDCDDRCEFLGHYCGHDVYLHEYDDTRSPSIIARHGDDGSDYGSMSVDQLIRSLTDGGNIGVHRHNEPVRSMPYVDWAFTEAPNWHRAMVIGLLVKGFGDDKNRT